MFIPYVTCHAEKGIRAYADSSVTSNRQAHSHSRSLIWEIHCPPVCDLKSHTLIGAVWESVVLRSDYVDTQDDGIELHRSHMLEYPIYRATRQAYASISSRLIDKCQHGRVSPRIHYSVAHHANIRRLLSIWLYLYRFQHEKGTLPRRHIGTSYLLLMEEDRYLTNIKGSSGQCSVGLG